MGYSKGEKILRCKLAAVFRLLDLYGWTQGVGGMITARLSHDQGHFLVNPYGLLFHEVTASSLVKVDMQGTVVEQGTTNFRVHIDSYQLHSTIYAARPDITYIVHIATPSVTAVSVLTIPTVFRDKLKKNVTTAVNITCKLFINKHFFYFKLFVYFCFMLQIYVIKLLIYYLVFTFTQVNFN